MDASDIAPIAMWSLPPQCAAQNRTYPSVAELTLEAMRTAVRTATRTAVLSWCGKLC